MKPSRKDRKIGGGNRRLGKGILLVMALTGLAGLLAMSQPQFGKLPDGERLQRMKQSPHYVDGEFRNQEPTPMFAEGTSRLAVTWEFLFSSREGLRPSAPLPLVKTDLKSIGPDRNVLVWLGHSSVFIQMDGSRFLIDPVFSGHAAPFSFWNKAFAESDRYSPDDMPEIDYLILSHDHWDHLDYPTMMALKPKIRAVICPLGVASHLEYWGFDRERMSEADWFDELRPKPGLAIRVVPARHFSGRWLTGNRTLWAGFLLETSGRRIFYSGDSGYGPHFADIGQRFGPVDLAIMENGQYDPSWKYIHMMPEEAAQGALDLRARALLPVHAGRFTIANHAWDDPYVRIAEASRNQAYRLLTPMIGEVVDLDTASQTFTPWWEAAARQEGESAR